jgi:hypothetical protein
MTVPTGTAQAFAPVPVDTGRQALTNAGLFRMHGMPPNDRHETWVRGNMPVIVPYASGGKTHFDGEAFANILAGK